MNPELKEDIEEIIRKAKEGFIPAPYDITGHEYEDIIHDFESFGIRDKSVIDTAIAVKVSTFIDTGEAPYLRLITKSGSGKTFTFKVISAIFGTIPTFDNSGEIIHVNSVAKSNGSPMSLIYSTQPENKADGIIWALDDSSVSFSYRDFLLRNTNIEFMQNNKYETVEGGKSLLNICPKNLRIIIAYAVLKEELKAAGMETRIVDSFITPMNDKERCMMNLADDTHERIHEIRNKWSPFWETLYDAVYFKNKRSKTIIPESFKTGEKYYSYENRVLQHIKCMATAYAVLRNPTAIINGTDVIITEEDMDRAEKVVASTIEMDDVLSGKYKTDTSYNIAKFCYKLCIKGRYTEKELIQTITNWLKTQNLINNHRYTETAQNGVRSFIKKECKGGLLLTEKVDEQIKYYIDEKDETDYEITNK